MCRITGIQDSRESPRIFVAWEQGGGSIDYDGLKPLGEAWIKWKVGNWALFDRGHIHAFLKNFQEGDLIPVQISGNGDEAGKSKLILSKIPEVEGGIVVLNRGMVKAMVGGFFDRYFNRAVDAKRQLGSVFKPLIYTAAMQLN